MAILKTDLALLNPFPSPLNRRAAARYQTGGIGIMKTFNWVSPIVLEGGGDPSAQGRGFCSAGIFYSRTRGKAAFNLDTTEDVTVNHWSVLIYDNSNHLVRGFRGGGSPPTHLVWGGENDEYSPLTPAVYTWSFQVQDNLGHIGSTPVQTVEILGPPAAPAAKDPNQFWPYASSKQLSWPRNASN